MCWSSLVVHGAPTACSILTMHVFTCAHCRSFGTGTNGEKEDEDSAGVAAKKNSEERNETTQAPLHETDQSTNGYDYTTSRNWSVVCF
jgi:hypothetical protein